jgi:hypothetical protein
MRALSAPEFLTRSEVVPTWVGLMLLAAIVGLLLVSAIVVGAVLVAAGRSPLSWPRVKSMAATGVWVGCAAGVVALVGLRAARTQYTAEKVPELESAAFEQSEQQPRLTIRQTSSDAPEWAVQPASGTETQNLVVLTSQRFATLEEAEMQITEKAAAEIREHCRREDPDGCSGEVPVRLINEYAVRELIGEVLDQDFGNGIKGKMYRAHLKLDLGNPTLQTAVQRLWHSQVAEQRLVVLGTAAGLITLMLGAAAGFFRLDDLTGGQYRGRLKLAAASLIAAGGLLAVRVIG